MYLIMDTLLTEPWKAVDYLQRQLAAIQAISGQIVTAKTKARRTELAQLIDYVITGHHPDLDTTT